MTVFDKVLINLHKGFEKLKYGAALFSERMKAEVNIIRMRIKVDNIRDRITELHAVVGRRIVTLRAQDSLPRSVEQLLGDEEIVAAMSEIAQLERERDELNAQLKAEATSLQPEPEEQEGPIL